MRSRNVVAICLLCSSAPALAQTTDDPTTSEEKKRFFTPRYEEPSAQSRRGWGPDDMHKEPSAPPSFGRIFRDLGGDFKRLPSKENAMWLGIGAGLAAASSSYDARVSQSFRGWKASEESFEPGAQIGSFYFTMGAAFATYAIGRATGDSKTATVGADLIRAQIVTQATTFAVKLAASRTRPNGEPYSFPSGHTSSAFATATVLQRHYGWKVGAPAYALATYVGASRIQSGRHYLSDVLFGATLGIVAGRTVTIGRSKFEIGPLVTPGGGVGIGLNLSR